MPDFSIATIQSGQFKLFYINILLSLSLPSSAQAALTYSDVAPIFNSNCIICHNGPAAPKGLRMDNFQNIKKGSQNGPVVLPGNASGSELVRRIRGESQPRMPLTGPPYLNKTDISRITKWINTGIKEGRVVIVAPEKFSTRKAGDAVSYSDVAPIFTQRCIKCHRNNAKNATPEGLSLQSYQQIIGGGERLVIIPGSPDASELVRRIKGISRPRMPFDGPPWLSEQEIALITDWIKQGAKSEDGKAAPPPVGQRVRLHGRLTGRWSLDGVPLIVDSETRMKKSPRVGDYVRVRGYIGNDGRIHATRIRRR